MQPDQLSDQNAQQPSEASTDDNAVPSVTSPATKNKRSRLNVAVGALGVLVFLILIAVVWTGYWLYTMNNEFIANQQQLETLQQEHAKLQSDYASLKSENEKLATDLTQTQADLEQANSDLVTAQDDSKTLNDKIEKARIKTNVILAIFVWDENDASVRRRIQATEDPELLDLYEKVIDNQDPDSFSNFFSYLWLSIEDDLK